MEQIILEEIIDHYNNTSNQDHLTISKNQYEILNQKQKEIVDLIDNTVNNHNTISNGINCFYIDGPGGSGKTFIYTTLYHMLRSENKNVNTMAYTEIAATLLPGGKTVHKSFGMPVPLYFDSSSNMKSNSKEYEQVKNTDVFT